MDYFANALTSATRKGLTNPRVHPLFLSLAGAYDESEDTPNISSVHEKDPRIFRSNYYTPAKNLPPLDIHFCGKNGVTKYVMLVIHCLQQ